jgi:hypothetical protein
MSLCGSISSSLQMMTVWGLKEIIVSGAPSKEKQHYMHSFIPLLVVCYSQPQLTSILKRW